PGSRLIGVAPNRDSNAEEAGGAGGGDYDRRTKTPGKITAAAVLGMAWLAVPARAAENGPAPAAPESGLHAVVARFDRLQVGAPGSVWNLRIASGHLQLNLRSGAAAPVKAGDEIVGVYFEGSAELAYTSADPVELPILTFNARKATSLDVEHGEGGAVVRDAP